MARRVEVEEARTGLEGVCGGRGQGRWGGGGYGSDWVCKSISKRKLLY